MSDAIAIASDLDNFTRSDFSDWVQRIQGFSDLVEEVKVRAAIALIGSALIAKATDLRINPFALRANAAVAGAYNVRGPAEHVLYPASLTCNFDIGSNSANPLNGQTFNKLKIVDKRLTLRGRGQQLVVPLNDVLHEISLLRSTEQALEALAAYVFVRRKFVRCFLPPEGEIKTVTTCDLRFAVSSWVSKDSEGGGRAQAAVGGLMDAIYGRDRVRVGKPNEPDRVVAGDVIVWKDSAQNSIEFANEVRDKTVSEIDCLSVIRKLAASGVSKGVIVAIAKGQRPIPRDSYETRAIASGLRLTIYTNWLDLIEQASQWSPRSDREIAEDAVQAIRIRATEMPVSDHAISEWDELTRNPRSPRNILSS